MSDHDPRGVDWRMGFGLNRMSWFRKPVHWMVERGMQPWDGTAPWSEKAHYVAFGPLRFFIEPTLRSEASLRNVAASLT